MNKVIWLKMFFIVLCAFAATTTNASNREYFTQFNVWTYNNRLTTDNFGISRIIPVNSKLRIIKVREYEAELEVGGYKFQLLINRSHSRKSCEEFLRLYLRSEPVELGKYSEQAQKAIQAGEIRAGMTKEEVLVARGYPPENATPDLNGNDWMYWRDRWFSFVAQFEEGKVVAIRQGTGKIMLNF